MKDRGRVPAELVARFKAATAKLGPECCRLAKSGGLTLADERRLPGAW